VIVTVYLLAEDMEHSGGSLSVMQCANVAQAEPDTDSDGSFMSRDGDDDDGGNSSDTNVDISEQEHDVGDSGDDNAISCELEEEMNTCGMCHSIDRAFVLLRCVWLSLFGS